MPEFLTAVPIRPFLIILPHISGAKYRKITLLKEGYILTILSLHSSYFVFGYVFPLRNLKETDNVVLSKSLNKIEKMDLKIIIEKLAKLIDPGETVVCISNIATLNDGDEFLASKSPIVLSIVNIEEDKTLKNQSVYIKNTGVTNPTAIDRYRHPTQHLIISILFSSYNQDLSKYLDGIGKLKTVIDYLQQNNSFYYKNDASELLDYITFSAKTEAQKTSYSKITLESISLSMEQLNQMWSYLGSKYMPSVLYKMRLCTIQAAETSEQTIITKVKIDLWENDRTSAIGLLETQEYTAEE